MSKSIKIASASDIHIREKKPRNRIDNFLRTQYRKYGQMFKIANKENVSFFGFAGDVFDTPHISYEFVAKYIENTKLNKGEDCVVGSVFGQHDLRYHTLSQLSNTPLNVLLKGIDGVLLDKDGYFIDDFICVKGVSWGETIPKPNANYLNILFMHAMVINDKLLFDKQTDFIDSKKLIRNMGYDLIITGDNHEQFYIEDKGKLLINNGSMMRQNINQINHIPRISIIELNKKGIVNFEWKDLTIKPYEMVFKQEVLEEKQNGKQEEESVVDVSVLDDFFEKLNNEDVKKENFIDKLFLTMDVAPEGVKKWIKKVLDEKAKENKVVD